MITPESLKTEINKIMEMSEDEVQAFITEVDFLGNGNLNYTDFLAAASDHAVNKKRILAVFDIFDTEHSGRIDGDDIFFGMQKLGINVSKDEIRQIMVVHD